MNQSNSHYSVFYRPNMIPDCIIYRAQGLVTCSQINLKTLFKCFQVIDFQ